MALDLAGVNTKLDRATTHWTDLHTPGRAGPLYPSVRLREEPGRPVRWVVDYLEPVSPDFAPTLGDCLHNYRSALDHLVAAIRAAEGLGVSRTSQWPMLMPKEIAKHATKWPEKLRRDLIGVPERVADVVRRHQPDRPDRPGAVPTLDVLFTLSELDNTDKHRRLTW